MAESRKPGRPKAGDQQVGRERIVEGVIEYVRAGHSDISRREIAAYLGITPALITYYFPKGFSLLTEAVERQSSRWLSGVAELFDRKDISTSRLIDQLQLIIIDMYTNDEFIVDLQTSLWRAGHMSYCLVTEMKRKASALLLRGETQIQRDMASFTASIIWGACEHCVRDHRDDLQPHIFNSGALLSGRLIIACKMIPTVTAAVRADA